MVDELPRSRGRGSSIWRAATDFSQAVRPHWKQWKIFFSKFAEKQRLVPAVERQGPRRGSRCRLPFLVGSGEEPAKHLSRLRFVEVTDDAVASEVRGDEAEAVLPTGANDQ